ncbi:MAG: hypothetical protein H7Y04_01410 [Verrucomicrobia bacterium]|nr:hypothetical protein [Cytophagales bacterium]
MKKKTIFAIIVILVGAGVAVGLWQYNRPHRQIASEIPSFSLSATELVANFNHDENGANKLYLDKVLSVSGIILEVLGDEQPTTLLLGDDTKSAVVSCTLDSTQSISGLTVGKAIKLKGRCTGMLMEVVLVDCFLEK